MNILDNFKSLLFCHHIFGARRSIDVLDPEKPARIRGLQRTSDTKSIKTKKEGLKNYLKYVFNRILKVSLRSRYKALCPNLAKTKSEPTL